MRVGVGGWAEQGRATGENWDNCTRTIKRKECGGSDTSDFGSWIIKGNTALAWPSPGMPTLGPCHQVMRKPRQGPWSSAPAKLPEETQPESTARSVREETLK